MKLFPAIDLLKGKCVRLVKGNFNQKKEFGNDPVKQAKFWEKEGAEFIHIVDLDAAKTGLPLNDSSIRMISESINIPIQIGGGIRSKERIEQLFSYGIDKVIMGTSAIENKKLVKEIASTFPKKIIIGIKTCFGILPSLNPGILAERLIVLIVSFIHVLHVSDEISSSNEILL